MQQLNEFYSLGYLITDDNIVEKEISTRFSLTQQAFKKKEYFLSINIWL